MSRDAFTVRDQLHSCLLIFLLDRRPAGVLCLGDVRDRARKAPEVGASEKEETTMKLLTRFELATRSTTELHALYREIFNALVKTAPGTDERRIALASLENIGAELRCRLQP